MSLAKTVSGLLKALDPVVNAAAKTYQWRLGKELNKVGLRFEDLASRDEPEFDEALQLAHPDVVEGRYRRLKRASDLSFKQKMLQDYAPDMILDPFKTEVFEDVHKIQMRDIEKDALNYHKGG